MIAITLLFWRSTMYAICGMKPMPHLAAERRKYDAA